MTNFNLATTIDVKECNGAYVGIVKELPIVVQANSIDELKEKISGAFALYIHHHQDEFTASMEIKVTA